MKIRDAKQAYSAQMNVLQAQRQVLRKVLEEQEKSSAGSQNFDRVELSRELSQLDAQYEAVRSGMEGIVARENAIMDAESAKQQSEAASEMATELRKCLEVYRRIASGAKVPSRDEKKLMEFSMELYVAAKQMAMLKAQKEDKEYDSLWENEKPEEETQSPSEIAAGSEISVSSPQDVAANAVAEAPKTLDIDIQV